MIANARHETSPKDVDDEVQSLHELQGMNPSQTEDYLGIYEGDKVFKVLSDETKANPKKVRWAKRTR